MAPTEPSMTSGRTMIDEFTVGATLSGLVTVSHNVHVELADVDTGVAYGAPGMPMG
jgi:hypothetical protein